MVTASCLQQELDCLDSHSCVRLSDIIVAHSDASQVRPWYRQSHPIGEGGADLWEMA